MTMYLLSSTAIINALIAQHQAGHEVKVLLNQTFTGGAGSNSQVFSQLQGAGVDVRWAPSSFTLTHEKCVVIDTSTAWIMTMNAAQSSPTANREYLAVDTRPADVAEAEAIFQGDWANTTPSTNGPLAVSPVNSRARVVALLDSSHTSVAIEAEELSDYMVVNSLVNARMMRSVSVKIVLSDITPTPAQTMAVMQLKTAGAQLVTTHTPYIHAKSAVVDGTQAFVGSENFTTGSYQYNRELGVFFNDATEIQKIITATNTDFSNGTPL
jgi:phosphatidylserine/phosphatidylglycerophosphate/cardiolipin synthase-like enzyme